MTTEQINKLSFVFDRLSDEQKNLDLLHLFYTDEYKNILTDHETISIEMSGNIKNISMFTGYSGVVNLLRVCKGKIILKPALIKELTTGRL